MRRKLINFLCFSILPYSIFSQVVLPSYPDSIFSTYYLQRVSQFETLPLTKGEIIFLGNSITDGGEWAELFSDPKIKNRGISGDISAGIIHRLGEIINEKPAKVFLLIGINDLAANIKPDSIVKNIFLIISFLHQESPFTKVFIQSILPVNDTFGKFKTHTDKGKEIVYINKKLKEEAQDLDYTFVNLYSDFVSSNGKMSPTFTNDGLHLLGDGYLLWKHIIYPYVYDLNPEPSLIPMPVKLKWKKGTFPLYECRNIIINDPSLKKNAGILLDFLKSYSLDAELNFPGHRSLPFIELKLGMFNTPVGTDEAYDLVGDKDSIVLTANTPHGIFNGIQTLKQLMRDGTMVEACEIKDWPAFSWRGYMVDVGRNYQSLDLLKKQVDVMAEYKLNVFHFHATEDIAWRLESKLYPQLTAPENMERNKGQYYSVKELKDLINYCNERFITFVPEIDMPGHSAAFKRAMQTDMQSDSGLKIIKKIIKEFFKTYHPHYLHIGADEVKIRNKSFIPSIKALLDSLGVKSIGWDPGGNLSTGTIHQLWMKNVGDSVTQSEKKYIDSRDLYLNHMDPLESVVTIFFRKLGDGVLNSNNIMGATLCLWPDRRVASENDIIRMNPVYPGMITFAERSWRGRGLSGWRTNLKNENEKNDFEAFEKRLLDHKTLYFKDKPFPYYQQSDITWNLYGPFSNGGDEAKSFSPEFGKLDRNAALKVTGGTVILRHWWDPSVKGVLPEPEENTTWYATTKIWSSEDTTRNAWIGFNDLSRSTATDSPSPGTWDNRQSKIWVNGQVVEPPDWEHGGQKGNSETPLIDEGYSFRKPTKISLHKGWNTILIKSPVGSFKGKDWQNPVKWMFTFLPL